MGNHLSRRRLRISPGRGPRQEVPLPRRATPRVPASRPPAPEPLKGGPRPAGLRGRRTELFLLCEARAPQLPSARPRRAAGRPALPPRPRPLSSASALLFQPLSTPPPPTPPRSPRSSRPRPPAAPPGHFSRRCRPPRLPRPHGPRPRRSLGGEPRAWRRGGRPEAGGGRREARRLGAPSAPKRSANSAPSGGAAGTTPGEACPVKGPRPRPTGIAAGGRRPWLLFFLPRGVDVCSRARAEAPAGAGGCGRAGGRGRGPAPPPAQLSAAVFVVRGRPRGAAPRPLPIGRRRHVPAISWAQPGPWAAGSGLRRRGLGGAGPLRTRRRRPGPRASFLLAGTRGARACSPSVLRPCVR